MNKNEIKVAGEVAEVAARNGLTKGQKVGVIVGATLITGALVYGVYTVVVEHGKHVKAKKAVKAVTEPTE